MLLSSPAFSNFLDDLSNNSQPVPAQLVRQVEQVQQMPQQMPPPPPQQQQQQQQQQQPPKDIAAYHVRPQVNMALVPETNIDFASLDLNAAFDMSNAGATWGNNQPQVFAVLELPEGPAIDELDMEAISGKSTSPAPLFEQSEKNEFPAVPVLPTIRETFEEKEATAPAPVETPVAELPEEVTAEAADRLSKLCGVANATRQRLEEMLL